MKNDFKVLSDIEHVLQRPNMYIGSVDKTQRSSYLFTDNKFEFQTFDFIPGLIKIIDEILDNAVDVAIRTNFDCDTIKVKVDDHRIIIEDNGEGIPVEKHDDVDKYLPELAWTQMRAGTSFDDDRKTIGANGLGSVCSVIFSKKFKGISDDGKNRFTLKCKNNLSDINHRITDSKSRGVKVEFEPDLERFGLDSIDEVHRMLVHQRLINLAVSYPQISFYFNGKKIRMNAKQFVKLFSDGKETSAETSKCILGILPNEYDDFKWHSYTNGIYMPNGGNHVDYVVNYIVQGVRDKLIKKHKTIKPGDIKNKIQLILFLREFPNPKFDSQTKERLTNSPSEMRNFVDLDLDKVVQMVLRNKDIIDPIVEMFRLKEELKAKKDLKNASKKKRIKSEKYIPPIKNSEMLLLCEGLSAMGGLSAILGRNTYGYYAMKGVPLNAYDSAPQKIAANVEIKEIASILDLDLHTDYKSDNTLVPKSISYNKVCIATDADADGAHISGLLLGLFYKYGRNLFDEKRIYRIKTPILFIKKNGKIVKYFMTLDEYNQWEKSNPNTAGLEFKYAKGLGSYKKEELQALINENGLDSFLEYFTIDDPDVIDRWLVGNRADDRKAELSNYTLNINQV